MFSFFLVSSVRFWYFCCCSCLTFSHHFLSLPFPSFPFPFLPSPDVSCPWLAYSCLFLNFLILPVFPVTEDLESPKNGLRSAGLKHSKWFPHKMDQTTHPGTTGTTICIFFWCRLSCQALLDAVTCITISTTAILLYDYYYHTTTATTTTTTIYRRLRHDDPCYDYQGYYTTITRPLCDYYMTTI